MTRMQRFKHFMKYFWKDSWWIVCFSAAVVLFPMVTLPWAEYSLWFWIILGVNTVNFIGRIMRYKQYINFNNR